jgi:DNA-binding MarR family transcriptional regulator
MTLTRSAAPLEAHLGFWLRFVSNHVSSRFQKMLENEGVSLTEWVALRTMLGQESTSHTQLIEVLGMTKGAASKVISRLQDKGLAERWLADGRQREQVLALTPRGQALVPRLAALADANDHHFFGHLTPVDRKGLMALMQGLVQHHQLKEVPTE